MGATDPAILAAGIAQSRLMAKYGQAVDRDSAQEMLARKVEQGSAAAEEEARAAAEAAAKAKEDAAGMKEAERQAAAAQREAERQAAAQQREAERQARVEASKPSLIESVATSSVFKSILRTAGNEIVRGIFGTARRR